MNYSDYYVLPFYKKITFKLGTAAKAFPKAFVNAVLKFLQVIARFFMVIGRGFKNYFVRFVKGDVRTKLSYVIMGSGSLLRGQIIKGFIFLFLQACYIVYMVTFGAEQLRLFTTLGVTPRGQQWDAAAGLYMYKEGDNSMLILLFGAITIVISIIMFVIYIKNTQIAYKNQEEVKSGGKLNSFIADAKTLLDKNIHSFFLSVAGIGIFVFTILPLLFMILIAFTNFDYNHQPPGNLFTWVGFQNFANVFYSDPIKAHTFYGVLIWTLVWAVLATFSCYVLGIILAMLINKKGIKLKKMWRTFFVITMAVPQFVTLLLMSQILDQNGPLNILLGHLGIAAVPFLTDVTWARISVILVNVWIGVPFTMLITSGILMNIPEDMYESARIDGAGIVAAFRKITMPYMFFITTPYLITQFIGNINNFNVIFFLTQGSPPSLDYYQAGKTDLLVTWLYNLSLNRQDYNLAATIGICIFVISAIVSLIVFNITSSSRKEGTYQ